MKKIAKKISILLILSLLLGGVSYAKPSVGQAKAKPKISNKKVTMEINEAKEIKVKNATKNVKWKTSNKKVVEVFDIYGKKNSKCILVSNGDGIATITAKVGKKSLKCKVIVGSYSTAKPTARPTARPTAKPTAKPTPEPDKTCYLDIPVAAGTGIATIWEGTKKDVGTVDGFYISNATCRLYASNGKGTLNVLYKNISADSSSLRYRLYQGTYKANDNDRLLVDSGRLLGSNPKIGESIVSTTTIYANLSSGASYYIIFYT